MHIPLGPGGWMARSPQKGLPETLLSGPCLCPYASRVVAPRHPWWGFLPSPSLSVQARTPLLAPGPGELSASRSGPPAVRRARLPASQPCGPGWGECGLAAVKEDTARVWLPVGLARGSHRHPSLVPLFPPTDTRSSSVSLGSQPGHPRRSSSRKSQPSSLTFAPPSAVRSAGH